MRNAVTVATSLRTTDKSGIQTQRKLNESNKHQRENDLLCSSIEHLDMLFLL